MPMQTLPFCAYVLHYSFQMEHSLLKSSFVALAKQMDLIFRKKLWFIMLEQFLMKYIWGAAGLIIVAWPILSGKNHEEEEGPMATVSGRTQTYTTARHLLITGADAWERLMTSYKEVWLEHWLL